MLLLSVFVWQQSYFGLFAPVAEAAVPKIINYQGRLQDASGDVLGGSGTNYDFKFSIWDAVSGGVRQWPASAPASTTHRVTSGVFDARLGDTDQGFLVFNIDFNTSTILYLQIEVWNATSSAFETLTPRQAIVASGFAINADTVDGADAGTSANNVLKLDPSGGINLPNGSSTFAGNLTVNGVSTFSGVNFSNATSTGNLYVAGIIRAGSGAIAITSSTGYIDASAILLSQNGSSTATSSNSGLQATDERLSLLRGCAAGQLLKWNGTTSLWECGSDISGTGGSITIERNDVVVSQTSTAVDFSAEFNVTESPSNEANVSINYASSGIVRSGQNETIAGQWTFASSTSMQGLTFTNATGTGNLQIATFTATGAASLQGLTFTNATGTTVNTSGSGTFGSITTAGQSSLASVSSTNILATGYLNVSGVSALQGLTFTNATGTGNLQVATLTATGQSSLASVSSTNLTASGYATLPTVNFTNASGTNLTASGYLQSAALTISGQSNLQSVSSTNILATGYLNVSGVSALQGLTFTNATGTGNLQIATLTATGDTSLARATFTNATGTTINTSANGTFGSITTGGQSLLSSVSSTNLAATGYITIGSTLNVSGQTSAASVSSTNLTASGYLQGATLAVSGQSSFASVSSTNTEASGYLRGGSLTVSGQSNLQSISSTNLGATGGISAGGEISSSLTGGRALSLTGTPEEKTSSSLVQLGPTVIRGGSVSGTYVGSNPATFNGDFINLQVNSSTQFKVSATGTATFAGNLSAGNLSLTNVSTTNISASGYGLFPTLSFTNASGTNLTASGYLQTATLSASGQSNLQSVSSTNLNATGYVIIGSTLNVSGQTTLAAASSTNLEASGYGRFPTLIFTNASGTNQTLTGYLIVSGQSSLQSASGTNIGASGYLSVAGQTSLSNASSANLEASGYLRAGGQSILQNVSGTNVTASGYLQGATLSISGQSSLASVSSTNAEASGYGRFPTLLFTNASGTNITASGYLQGASLSISGQSSLASVSSTNLYASGYLTVDGQSTLASVSSTNISASGYGLFPTLAFTNASGTNLTASGYLQGASLNISGVSALQGLTFTNATGTGNLQVATLRTTGDATFDGRVAIGTSTFTAAISIATSTNASLGIAGIFQDIVMNPTAAGGFQFGNRSINRVSSTATTTAIGTFIRMIDNTNMSSTVKGLEIQANSGSNNQGENIGLHTFGRTFGVKAITTGEAGGIIEPAAVYGELQNGTQGNAFRAHSSTSTTATLVQFFQDTSAFSGTGLLMNFGNGIGNFTGNFLNLQRASTTKFAINSTGTVVIASSTAAAGASSTLTVCAQTNCTLSATSTGAVAWFASVDGTTSTNSIVARGTIAANSADFGEYVPVMGSTSDYEAGDLLSVSSSSVIFTKSDTPHDVRLAGAVTVSAAFVGGLENGTDGKVVMAVAGRIPVKVSGENGAIHPGDPIAASSLSGHGMKATRAGRALGIALETFEPLTPSSTSKILVLVNPHWYVPEVTIAALQGGTLGTGEALNTFTFDPTMTYSFENLKVQNLEIGSPERPNGITIYDTVTKEPYCIVVENGNMKSIPGKCLPAGQAGGAEPALQPMPSLDSAPAVEPQPMPSLDGTGTGGAPASDSPATTETPTDTTQTTTPAGVSEPSPTDTTTQTDPTAETPLADTSLSPGDSTVTATETSTATSETPSQPAPVEETQVQ